MKKPELLAPVGSWECLVAAIEAGCDAVYLGGYAFGARGYAKNFSKEELKRAVQYAHLYGVKVYITVNTLVYENEVPTFLVYIDYLCSICVDALILQDLGMFDLIHQLYPDMELHASTQMHLHNQEGILCAKRFGFKRAVVAREMSYLEISEIRKNVNIELEVFVHGALCISYSGQCLMSSLIGGRSGNRGTCAGSCRQKYDYYCKDHGKLKKKNNDAYVLSTRDLCTIDEIGKLIDIGVDSFKIEGRMKRPEYVYVVVSLYRKAIDQYCAEGKIQITEEDRKELQKIFYRQFTTGFLFNEQDVMNPKRPNHMGVLIGKVVSVSNGQIQIVLQDCLQNGDGIRILGKDDVGMTVTKMKKGNKIIKQGRKGDQISLYSTEKVQKGSLVVKTTDKEQLDRVSVQLNKLSRKVKIQGNIRLKLGEYPVLTLYDKECQVTVQGKQKVEPAMNQPISLRRVLEQVSKMGNSVYELENLEVDMGEGLFIPILELNELRRQAVEELNQKRLKRIPVEKKQYKRKVLNFPVEKKKNVLLYHYAQYEKIKGQDIDTIYVETEELYQKLKSDSRVVLKLPRVMHHFPSYGGPLLISEMGSLYSYSDVATDFSFNVTNSYTVSFLHALGVKSVTLSYELTDLQIQDLITGYINRYSAHPNLELIVKGREEVMVTKFSFTSFYGVGSDGQYLQDRFGNFYPIVPGPSFDTIYHFKERNLALAEKYYAMGISQLRYQFPLFVKEGDSVV